MTEQQKFLPDIEIARKATMAPIEDVAVKLGIDPEHIERYGKVKAKISLEFYNSLDGNPTGKLILVSAISPTSAGEGKTTVSVGLADGLNAIGKKTTVCLREPSLGPCFGMKGGAAGGGFAQVVPMEDINLHFTGDFHAIGLAHNLLSAVLDNHIHQGNKLNIDVRRIVWKRVVDMNDRALRQTVIGLGGIGNSVPRESGFDITVASEVMAIFCLSESLGELKKRLGKIIVAYTRDRKPVTAANLKVHGAMAVLLRDALKPNLVQTLENNPAIIHGGPFANIAHGCNSVVATKLAMRLSEYTVTEAGFGADLGAEKFFNIKCRKAGLKPDAVVLVATIRALKLHGGADKKNLRAPDLGALEKGLCNLKKHIENIHSFGVPVVVAINVFADDTADEFKLIKDKCAYLAVPIIEANHFTKGGAGAVDLARAVVETTETTKSDFKPLYEDELPLWQKIKTIARRIYGADDIIADASLRKKIASLQEEGYGHYPICMAKTQYSLSSDPSLIGTPKNFVIPLREVRLAAGAEFLVVLTGSVLTMPGLPRVPSAEAIDLDENGEVVGLF
ncbi:MAG: formate--tetrahydrofolate ligase [Verrucomicrobia bacterium]|nr:MAG: formate--tetrahydrofolate ligase [Verrucomicrobiota bacterium]